MAEVTLHGIAKPDDKLQWHGFIQSHRPAGGGQRIRIGEIAEHQTGRVAGYQADKAKHRHRDDEQGGDCRQ
ncbi:hypothetical protein D3C71_1938630 [compost metagenome]